MRLTLVLALALALALAPTLTPYPYLLEAAARTAARKIALLLRW